MLVECGILDSPVAAAISLELLVRVVSNLLVVFVEVELIGITSLACLVMVEGVSNVFEIVVLAFRIVLLVVSGIVFIGLVAILIAMASLVVLAAGAVVDDAVVFEIVVVLVLVFKIFGVSSFVVPLEIFIESLVLVSSPTLYKIV